MYIIEIEYVSNLGTAEEIDDYFLSSLPSAIPSDSRLVIYAVKSSNDDFVRVKGKIESAFGPNFDFLKLGTNLYGPDEIRLIYNILAIAQTKSNVTVRSLLNDEEVTIGDDAYYSSDSFKTISNYFSLFSKAACVCDIVEFNYLIGYIRNAVRRLPPSTLKSAIEKAIFSAKSLLDTEKILFYGNEERTISAAISANYYYDFVSSRIYNISALYDKAIKSQSVVTTDLRKQIQKRESFLNYGRIYAQRFTNDINNARRPGTMVWFAFYLLIIAEYYRTRGKYTAAIALCIRSLELYCQSVLIFIKKGELGTNGNFRLLLSKKSGVMEYWNQVKDNISTLSKEQKEGITNSILFRNKSVFAHEIQHASEDNFYYIFNNLTETYATIEKFINPSNDFWEGLSKFMTVNLCKHLEQNIALNILSYCRVELQK